MTLGVVRKEFRQQGSSLTHLTWENIGRSLAEEPSFAPTPRPRGADTLVFLGASRMGFTSRYAGSEAAMVLGGQSRGGGSKLPHADGRPDLFCIPGWETVPLP